MEKTPIEGFCCQIPPQIKLLDDLFEDFILFLNKIGIDPKQKNEWKVIFMEAVSNAIVHGSKQAEEEKNRVIDIAWSLRGKELWLEICDGGNGPEQDLSVPVTISEDVNKSSGRGLYLIQELSDRFYAWRGPRGFKLTIIKDHPYIDHAEKSLIKEQDDSVLNATLSELSHSYESLTAFYQLGEALIQSESAYVFINKALRNLDEVVSNDGIFFGLTDTLEAQLLKDLRASRYFYKVLDKEGLQTKEQLWESPAERPKLDYLETYYCGMYAPIMASGSIIGFLVIGRRDNRPYLNAGEMNTIRTFADLLGISIAQANNSILRDQAQRAVSELEIAASIQKKLVPLPKLKNSEHWNLYTMRKSAREIGGDYVDAFVNLKGSLYMIMVDVMGKGVSAAFVAGMIRTAFQIQLDLAEDLSSLIHSLNRVLCKQTENLSMFATCSIVHIPAGSKRIEVVNAGHCPIIFYENKKRKRHFEPSGPPLGIFPEANYKIEGDLLGDTNQLVMVTDGLYEWMYSGELWGWDRLLQLVDANCDSGEKIWQELQKLIDFNVGLKDIRDDQTLLYWEYKE